MCIQRCFDGSGRNQELVVLHQVVIKRVVRNPVNKANDYNRLKRKWMK